MHSRYSCACIAHTLDATHRTSLGQSSESRPLRGNRCAPYLDASFLASLTTGSRLLVRLSIGERTLLFRGFIVGAIAAAAAGYQFDLERRLHS
jgi:hypothetical protein